MSDGQQHQQGRRGQQVPYHMITVGDVYTLVQQMSQQMTVMVAEQHASKSAQAARELELNRRLSEIASTQDSHGSRLSAIEARRWPLSSIATICSVVAVLGTVYGLLQR